MKITVIYTHLVCPRWGFIEIETNEGLISWGEAVIEGKAATVQTCIEDI